MNAYAQTSFVRLPWTPQARRAGGFLLQTTQVNEQEIKDRDADLLRRIGAKDRAAFEEFYDNYSVLLFSIASRILNDASEAEDVLQETFVQVWEKASNFDPKLGKASSWAAVLVRNKSIDRIRSSQRRLRLAKESGAERDVLADDCHTVNGTLYGREKEKLIREVLAELPSQQRDAIEMAFFSGLTQIEISEALHEPLGTIKARIRRGLLKLRDQLKDLL